MPKPSIRNLVLRSATAAILVLGPCIAMAQAPGGERGGGEKGGGERGGGEPRGGGAPGGMSPGAGGGERGPAAGAERGPGSGGGKAAEKPNPAAEKAAPGGEKRPGDAKEPNKAAGGGAKPDAKGGGEAGKPGGHGGRASLSGEQRTRFTSVIRDQHVEVIHGPSFGVNVGTIIPERYHFYPLPPALIELVPDYRGYDYIIVDNTIIILEPGTRRIVDIIEE